MRLPRRGFLGLIPVSALSLQLSERAVANVPAAGTAASLIISPPVVQHPAADGFTVHFAVSALATGWVEWGWSADRLDHVAIAARHGLVHASDLALSVRVRLDDAVGATKPVYYRVVAQSLAYKNAYQLERGESVGSEVRRLRLPSAGANQITIAIVNDTHENKATLDALHARVAAVDPDVLVWNGDTCNDFDAQDDPMQIVLNPNGDLAKGWASERPLLFVPGNHDVRGQRARELSAGLSGWPDQSELPYNFALRLGPVALVGLDTGEDKPDAHPVFAGTAAYEQYREQQATWLKKAVERLEIAEAPIRIAVCHIPLRGLPGHNDGTTLEGYASYCGMGAKLWLPILRRTRFAAVISGHMHQHRIDAPNNTESVMQIVGGGPRPEGATLTIVHADGDTAEVRVEDLAGKTLSHREWSLSAR
jgi:3',5'-cyclic AMP phosphodiesterase CpdA